MFNLLFGRTTNVKSEWKMNKRFVYIATVLLIMNLLIVNCGDEEAGNGVANGRRGDGQRRGNQQSAAIPVQAVAVKRGAISRYLMQTMTIEAERQVDILAKVSGQVVKLPAEEGVRVKTGDLLVQLDEAELKINYMRSKVSYETDQSVYQRSKEMVEKKFIAAEQHEAARMQLESSKSAFEAAKLQLEYTNVRAPFDGVVTLRNIELGQRVNVNEALFILADFEPLRAKIYVPEKDIISIFEGQGATITVEAQPDIEFRGVVRMVSPVVDPASGTSKVTIDISDDKGRLKPGMFASVFITTETHENVLVIPKKALVLETDLDQVYIYQDGTAHKVNLRLGLSSGETVEVLDGLQEGELVVTAGQDGLREGLPIRIPGQEPKVTSGVDSSARPAVMAANARGGQERGLNRGGGDSQMDPERLKRMEKRMLQNPEIKKEWDKRLKKDPDLKNNDEKKMAFFQEMRGKMRGGRRN